MQYINDNLWYLIWQCILLWWDTLNQYDQYTLLVWMDWLKGTFYRKTPHLLGTSIIISNVGKTMPQTTHGWECLIHLWTTCLWWFWGWVIVVLPTLITIIIVVSMIIYLVIISIMICNDDYVRNISSNSIQYNVNELMISLNSMLLCLLWFLCSLSLSLFISM